MERILMFVMLLGISGSIPIPGYVPDDSFCIQKVNGNYEYPAPHCSYFYQCVDGLTYILECYSKSLYYNQDTDRCDWHWSFPDEKRAECGIVDQKLQGNSRPARAVASKSDDAVFCRGRPDGNYEYPAPECYKFYACSNGYTYVMQCPSKGFYYNPENDQCDWPYNLPPQRQAECEGREYTGDGVEGTKPTTTPSSTRPSHGPSDPFCEGKDDGNYEHPAPNCSLYYACSNGNAHILRCATDELYFDQAADRCDWYYNFPEEKQAACQGREYTGVGEVETKPVPSPTQPSGGPSDDPFCEDKVDGNYEYPAPNCSLYYACSNGLTYIMECGEGGLYYNQSSDRCEWSWSFPEEKQSECEGRSYTDEPVEETTDDPSGPEEIIDDEDTFCSDKVDANYEYPAPNCSQFYSCSNGRTHVMNCYPNSLYYHQQLDRCEWPSNFSESKQRECQGLPPLEDLNNDEEKKRIKRSAGRFGYASGVDVV